METSRVAPQGWPLPISRRRPHRDPVGCEALPSANRGERASSTNDRDRNDVTVGCDVLVVEDDETIRDQLAEALEYEGFSVTTASNGREALERLCQAPVRTVIMDLMMPVMNGWELVQSMRGNARLATIPILTITAVSNAHRAPGGPLFLKPLNIGSLIRAVRTYVGRA